MFCILFPPPVFGGVVVVVVVVLSSLMSVLLSSFCCYYRVILAFLLLSVSSGLEVRATSSAGDDSLLSVDDPLPADGMMSAAALCPYTAVPLAPGDMVVFGCRTPHRIVPAIAMPPPCSPENEPLRQIGRGAPDTSQYSQCARLYGHFNRAADPLLATSAAALGDGGSGGWVAGAVPAAVVDAEALGDLARMLAAHESEAAPSSIAVAAQGERAVSVSVSVSVSVAVLCAVLCAVLFDVRCAVLWLCCGCDVAVRCMHAAGAFLGGGCF